MSQNFNLHVSSFPKKKSAKQTSCFNVVFLFQWTSALSFLDWPFEERSRSIWSSLSQASSMPRIPHVALFNLLLILTKVIKRYSKIFSNKITRIQNYACTISAQRKNVDLFRKRCRYRECIAPSRFLSTNSRALQVQSAFRLPVNSPWYSET